MSNPTTSLEWGYRVCLCCHMTFDYLKRDRERQPIACNVCAADRPSKDKPHD